MSHTFESHFCWDWSLGRHALLLHMETAIRLLMKLLRKELLTKKFWFENACLRVRTLLYFWLTYLKSVLLNKICRGDHILTVKRACQLKFSLSVNLCSVLHSQKEGLKVHSATSNLNGRWIESWNNVKTFGNTVNNVFNIMAIFRRALSLFWANSFFFNFTDAWTKMKKMTDLCKVLSIQILEQ